MVGAVLADYRAAPIGEAEKALLGLVDKATAVGAQITPQDVDGVLAAGWTTEAVYDALTVTALFNFYNTWIDATGVRDMPAAAYAASGARLASHGYAPPEPEPGRALLRHALATLAYRGGKAVRGMSEAAAAFRAGDASRSPLAILAHVNDLLDWALSLCAGEHVWHDSTPATWADEVGRFHAGLHAVDARLAAPAPLGCSCERLFQGPIADALTHVGQIALLRRLAGEPVRGENYFKAEIQAGRVGPDQAAPRREFD
jgi:hypothetical protein